MATIIHEMTHQTVFSHGERFARVMGDNTARLLAPLYRAQDRMRLFLKRNDRYAYKQVVRHQTKLLSK